jgi:ubiquinone/menaquinone biosynthesis C-methylase UbiE
MSTEAETMAPDALKSCCTTFYENPIVGLVLGETFHPGGTELTLSLGTHLGLNKDSRVLDVACGSGVSAIALVKQFGCHVTGVDLSQKNLDRASATAASMDLTDKLKFVHSDAEVLKFDAETFDAVICECALCTFPDKETAAGEMFRILKQGSVVGITDVTIESDLPESLRGIMSYVLCITGALSANGYQKLLKGQGFKEIQYIDKSETITEILGRIDKLLMGWNVVEKLCSCNLEDMFGITLSEAKELLKVGTAEVSSGNIGYGMFVGSK